MIPKGLGAKDLQIKSTEPPESRSQSGNHRGIGSGLDLEDAATDSDENWWEATMGCVLWKNVIFFGDRPLQS